MANREYFQDFRYIERADDMTAIPRRGDHVLAWRLAALVGSLALWLLIVLGLNALI
ncbi:MAG TPA: hypothetical protein VE631_05230 [Alphaproteobacteria bacterium]|nr:hypothetical protein [Alphaproteobacteria bacterium]